jgi:GT2 family glycosyltransferase
LASGGKPAAITVVLVLYEKAPLASEAFLSLGSMLDAHPAWTDRFQIVLYDNSTTAASVDSFAPGVLYVHDAANGGLSAAYAYAFQQARSHGSEWLLLLDQDTTLTEEYLLALLEAVNTSKENKEIGAIVPLLELDGILYSPEENFFYHLRHQFPQMRYYRASSSMAGLQSRPLNAYNSGALLRVIAIEAIGGFPSDFRIDYLDHAVFHLLHQHGFLLYVVPTRLQQKLSHADLDTVSLSRHTSVLRAQTLFVSRYGTLLDGLLFRLWLLRKARPYRALCKDPEVWKGMVRQAVGLPVASLIFLLLDLRGRVLHR